MLISHRKADLRDRISKKPTTISFSLRAQGHSGPEDDLVYEGSKVEPNIEEYHNQNALNMLADVGNVLTNSGEWFGESKFRIKMDIFALKSMIKEYAETRPGFLRLTTERYPSARLTTFRIEVTP